MTHLLDTHVLLWALGNPDRLGGRARAVLEDPEEDLVVSAVSAWEISTKHRLGKLPRGEVVLANYGTYLRRLGVRPLPITQEHALLAGQLDWAHRDPFDRMLAAVAMTEGYVLVTRDPAFAGVVGLRTLW